MMQEPAAAPRPPKSRCGPSQPSERVANGVLQLRGACCHTLEMLWPVRLTAGHSLCYKVMAAFFGPASWTGSCLLDSMTAAA